MEISFVVILRTLEGFFLMMTGDGKVLSIHGFKSLKEAKDYFEVGYNTNHARGYEPSMSACINFIQFTPSIVQFPSLENMIETLKLKECKPFRLHSVSGHFDGLKLDDKIAEPIWEKGERPGLITEDFNRIKVERELAIAEGSM